jgi:hypothetical protein
MRRCNPVAIEDGLPEASRKCSDDLASAFRRAFQLFDPAIQSMESFRQQGQCATKAGSFFVRAIVMDAAFALSEEFGGFLKGTFHLADD